MLAHLSVRVFRIHEKCKHGREETKGGRRGNCRSDFTDPVK